MNFAGLGLSFAAQDKGLGKAIKTASSGLADISTSVVEIGAKSARMGLGAALRMPNIGGAASALQGLGNDVRITTTYMEGFAVQSNRTSAQLLAGLNLTSKEFSKRQGQIKNIAFDMNIDAATVGQSMAALVQSGVEVTEAGFKSFKEYQKVMTVTGADSAQFASALGVMKNQLGMTPEVMSDVVKSTAAIGKRFNMGREAMASLSDQVQILNENAQLLPKSFGPKEQARFLKGTTMVSGAMRSLGFSSDQAISASKRLTTVLLQSRAGFERLYAGLGELPAASKALAEHFPKGVEDAFQLLEKSPDQFVMSMGKVVDSVRQNIKDMSPDQQQKVMRRFQSQMHDTFGPEVLALINRGFGKVGPAMQAAQDPLKEAAKALSDLAEKHRDGRTAAERFMLAEDQMFTRMKRIKGVMKDSDFLKEYRKQSVLLTDQMGVLAAKGGPIGKATTMMVEFANHGVGGVLGKMIGPPDIGLAVGALAKKFGPVLDSLPALRAGFLGLMSPITLVASLVGGLYYHFSSLAKGGKGLTPAIDKVKGKLKEIAPAVLGAVKAALGAAKDVLMTVFKNIDWGKVAAVASQLAHGMWDLFGRALLSAAEGVKILTWALAASIDLDTLSSVFANVGKLLIGVLVEVAQAVPGMFYAAFKITVSMIIGLWDALRDYLAEKFPKAFHHIYAAFETIKPIIKSIAVLVGVTATYMIAKWVAVQAASVAVWVYTKAEAALSLAFQVAKTIWAAGIIIAKYVLIGIAGAAAFFVVIAPIALVVAGIYGLVKVVMKLVGTWDRLKAGVSLVFKGIVKAAKWFAGLIFDICTWPVRMIWEKWDGLREFLTGIWDGIKNVASAAWEGVKGAVGAAWSWIKGESDDSNLQIKRGMKGTSEAAKQSSSTLKEAYTSASNRVREVATGVKNAVTGYLGELQKQVAAANAMKLPGLRGELGSIMGEIEALQKKRREAVSAQNKEARQNIDEQMKAVEERMQKEYGVSVATAKRLTAGIREQLKYREAALKDLSGVERKLAEEALARNATHWSEQALRFAKQVGEIGDRSDAKLQEISKNLQAQFEKDKALSSVVTEAIKGRWTLASKSIQGDQAKMTAAFHAMAEGFRHDSAEMAKEMAKYGPQVEQKADKALKAINVAYSKELRDLKNNTKLTLDQRKKEQERIVELYTGMRKKLGEELKKAGDEAKDVGEDVVKSTESIFDSLFEGLRKRTDRMKQIPAEAAPEIKKLGLTGAEAAQSVQEIATINTRKLKNNLKAIDKLFIKQFLKNLEEKGVPHIDALNNSFNRLFEGIETSIVAQTVKLEKFFDDIRAAMKKMWRALALDAAEGLVRLGVKLFMAVNQAKAILSNINMMNLLASPSDIAQWANAVVLALSKAFLGGRVWDAAIGSAYQRSLALITELDQRGAASVPGGGTARTDMQRQEASQAAERIRTAIDEPRWTREGVIPKTLQEQNELLKKLLVVVGVESGAFTAEQARAVVSEFNGTP